MLYFRSFGYFGGAREEREGEREKERDESSATARRDSQARSGKAELQRAFRGKCMDVVRRQTKNLAPTTFGIACCHTKRDTHLAGRLALISTVAVVLLSLAACHFAVQQKFARQPAYKRPAEFSGRQHRPTNNDSRIDRVRPRTVVSV